MYYRISAGIGIICFSSFMTVLPFTSQELIIALEGNKGDPYIFQEESFEILNQMVEGEESLGYLTNPDDFEFLHQNIFSASTTGVSLDTLTIENLRVIGRFNRTQYYMAPHVLRLYNEGSRERYVVANFWGKFSKRPAYQIGDLRIRRNLGNGVVLYYNGGL